MDSDDDVTNRLPDEILLQILSKVDYRTLCRVEECSRRMNTLVRKGRLWERSCFDKFKSLKDYLPKNQPKNFYLRISVAIEKARNLDLEAQDPHVSSSLIAEAVTATSTDHPEESISNVLSSETRVRRDFFNLCYWSSQGCDSPTGSDAILFRLKHPLSVVAAVQIRPFEAHFQRGNPIYSSTFVRISLGMGRCETKDLSQIAPLELAKYRINVDNDNHPIGEDDSDHGWTWISDIYPMDHMNVLQTFSFPPALCCGGYVRIELLGRKQKQEIDNLYYVCLSQVRILGIPLEEFKVDVPLLEMGQPRRIHRIIIDQAEMDHRRSHPEGHDYHPNSISTVDREATTPMNISHHAMSMSVDED